MSTKKRVFPKCFCCVLSYAQKASGICQCVSCGLHSAQCLSREFPKIGENASQTFSHCLNFYGFCYVTVTNDFLMFGQIKIKAKIAD